MREDRRYEDDCRYRDIRRCDDDNDDDDGDDRRRRRDSRKDVSITDEIRKMLRDKL